MAGSVEINRELKDYGKNNNLTCEIITITWVADGSGNVSVVIPNISGFALKGITAVLDTPPDDQYNVILGDPADPDLDALGGSLNDRSNTTTEQKFLKLSDGVSPVFLAGDYTFQITDNTVANATGLVVMYLVD